MMMKSNHHHQWKSESDFSFLYMVPLHVFERDTESVHNETSERIRKKARERKKEQARLRV